MHLVLLEAKNSIHQILDEADSFPWGYDLCTTQTNSPAWPGADTRLRIGMRLIAPLNPMIVGYRGFCGLK